MPALPRQPRSLSTYPINTHPISDRPVSATHPVSPHPVNTHPIRAHPVTTASVSATRPIDTCSSSTHPVAAVAVSVLPLSTLPLPIRPAQSPLHSATPDRGVNLNDPFRCRALRMHRRLHCSAAPVCCTAQTRLPALAAAG